MRVSEGPTYVVVRDMASSHRTRTRHGGVPSGRGEAAVEPLGEAPGDRCICAMGPLATIMMGLIDYRVDVVCKEVGKGRSGIYLTFRFKSSDLLQRRWGTGGL